MLWRPAPEVLVWRDRPVPVELAGFFVGLASPERLPDARRWLRLLDGSFPQPPARLLLLGQVGMTDAFAPSFAPRILVCQSEAWSEWTLLAPVFAGWSDGTTARLVVFGPPTDAGWDLLEASAPTA